MRNTKVQQKAAGNPTMSEVADRMDRVAGRMQRLRTQRLGRPVQVLPSGNTGRMLFSCDPGCFWGEGSAVVATVTRLVPRGR